MSDDDSLTLNINEIDDENNLGQDNFDPDIFAV
jgi:hypothetical protein